MKKNIAIVITRLDLGGAQQVALYLAKNIDRKKYNVYLISGEGGYLDDEAKKIKELNLIFMKSLKHPISLLNDIKALFELKKFFKEKKIDVVHTHSSKAGILGRIAAKMAGVKMVMHTIHGFPFHKFQNPVNFFIYLILEKFAAKFCDKLVAVGKEVVDYGLKNKVGKKEQYAVIRAGIDVNLFKNAKVNKKEYLLNYGLSDKKITVGMIGNLKKQKNPLEFVNIAKEVIKVDDNVQFIFAGDGPLRNKVNYLLKKYGIEKNVKFVGWIKEPEKFIKAIDIFILTSLWEGLPCTLIQAIVAGKVCIATNIDGNKEILSKINPWLLYEPRNYIQAAKKILILKNEKDHKKHFNIEKVKDLIKEFDFKFMLNEYEKLYDL